MISCSSGFIVGHPKSSSQSRQGLHENRPSIYCWGLETAEGFPVGGIDNLFVIPPMNGEVGPTDLRIFITHYSTKRLALTGLPEDRCQINPKVRRTHHYEETTE